MSFRSSPLFQKLPFSSPKFLRDNEDIKAFAARHTDFQVRQFFFALEHLIFIGPKEICKAVIEFEDSFQNHIGSPNFAGVQYLKAWCNTKSETMPYSRNSHAYAVGIFLGHRVLDVAKFVYEGGEIVHPILHEKPSESLIEMLTSFSDGNGGKGIVEVTNSVR